MAKRDDAIGPEDNKQASISRRDLFHTAALATGGAAVLLVSSTAAQAKMPQKGAGYQDTPKGDQKCSNCSLFKPPSTCILVDGTISPDGWCRFWKKVA